VYGNVKVVGSVTTMILLPFTAISDVLFARTCLTVTSSPVAYPCGTDVVTVIVPVAPLAIDEFDMVDE
jgi:hypothetical protein